MSPEDPVRILIADDEKAFLKALVTYLEAPHRRIRTASSGTQALETLKDMTPDIVITDLVMPGCDGLAVLREAMAGERKPLVIMMTGYGSIDTAVRAMKEGAFDYKAKPFLLEEMGLCLAKAEDYLCLLKQRDALLAERARLLDEISSLKLKIKGAGGGGEPLNGEVHLMPLPVRASRTREAMTHYKKWDPVSAEEDDFSLLRGLLEQGLITEVQLRRLLKRLSSSEGHSLP